MPTVTAGLWGGCAAASLLLGAILALRVPLSNRFVGAVMGFGAGALISSIAYELVPESLIGGGEKWLAISFGAGALVFFGLDWWIDERGGESRKNIAGATASGTGSAIFLGTLLDGIPESLVLGIGMAMGGSVGVSFLIAVFVSNIPEAIAGTRSMLAGGATRRRILVLWSGLVIASALFSAAGFALVQWMPGIDGRYMRAFAGGAVLTMLADVMMPEAFEQGGKLVGILATLGYLVAAILSIMD